MRSWWVLVFCLLLVAVGSASASVTKAEAQGTNAAPVAKDNEYRVKKGTTLKVPNPGVLRNDLDPDGDALSAARDSSPRHGKLSLRSGGSFVYTPDKGYRGKDSFVYRATDAAGGADTATVEITVWSPDRLPLARNDVYGMTEDGTLTVPAPGVLKNDAEADGRRLFATKVTDPGHGSLSLVRDGSFVYTPDENFNGEDSFVYRARDGRGRSDEGTVEISVDAVNDVPFYTDAPGNTSQTIGEGAGLAALDVTNADGDALAFELTGGSLPPGITLGNDGRFTGTAGGRAAGNYTASIKVSDGDGETDTTDLAVTVNEVEEAALAQDTDVTTNEDVAKTITLSATDADTDTLTFSVGSPDHGSLGTPSAPDCDTSAGTTTCTMTVLYTPDADFNGSDSFTYTAEDSESATVNITVNAVNDEPVARADTKTTPENTPLVFPASDLVANDSEGAANEGAQELSVDSVSNPAGGTVVLDNDEITFTPTADYNGPASFEYTVCDNGSPQECSTQTATVNVTVSPVNSTPTASATPESLDIEEDAAAQSVRLAGADTETGAANLRFTITEAPAHGVLKKDTTTLGNDDGFTGSPTDVTYKPDADYNGSDLFEFEVADRGDPDNCGTPAPACAAQKSDVKTVPVTVNSVVDPTTISSGGTLSYTENDPPTPVDGGLGVTHPEGTQISKAEVRITNNYQGDEDVLAFDDNDPADNITLDSGSAGATLTLTGADSAANYQAALRAVTYENTSENPSGLTRTVTFTATDANSVASSPATRDIVVTSVDDPPVAVNDSATVLEDAPATDVPVLTNDTDVDGGTKAISSASDPANGTVAVTGGGTGLTYRPDANYCNDPPATNLDAFTYTLNGGSEGTVRITVTCVNDAPVADNESFSGTDRAVGNTSLVGDDPSDGAQDPVGPQKTITGDILDGDTDVDGPGTLAVTGAGTNGTNGQTTNGGQVTVQPDGDFTYHPPVGCNHATDTFEYTVSDGHSPTPGTDQGTVTVNIADCVWYVDDSAPAGGDGRSHSQFNSFASISSASGAGDADDPNDDIFLYPGAYSGGLPLENGQNLQSKRHGLQYGDGGTGTTTLEAADPAGSHSTLSGGLVLGQDNFVQGVDLGSHTGFALSNAGTASVTSIGGTAQVNNLTSGAVNNPSGGGVNVANGGNINFRFQDGFTTGGGTHGINLAGSPTGTFNSDGTGTISGATTTDVVLNGGSVNFTLNSTISDDGGQLVSISNQTGGTKDFNGPVNDVTTNPNNGGGISLQSNGNALTRFDGGLNLSTGSSNGLVATNGGTLALPDPAGTTTNSIASMTGTPVNVAFTTIHADDLVFEKISSNGSANGIVLNNTGTSGGLTVTGNGGSCTIATPTCTGGTIQNTTGDGMVLTNTKDVSLSFTRNLNAGGQGVNGASVNGFTLKNSLNIGAGNADEENGLRFGNDDINQGALTSGLSGAVLIQDVVIDSPIQWGLRLYNSTGDLNMTVRRLTVQNNRNVDNLNLGEDAVSMRVTGGTSNVLMDDSDFLNVDGGVTGQAIGTPGGTLNLTVQNSNWNQVEALPFGINFNTGGQGTGRLKATGNTMVGCTGTVPISRCSVGIDLDASVSSTLDATILNNTISNTGIGSGMEFIVNENAIGRAEVRDNIVNLESTQTDKLGMNFHARNVNVPTPSPYGQQTGTLDLTLEGNTINNVNPSGGAAYGAFNILAGTSDNTINHPNRVTMNLDDGANGAGGNVVNGVNDAPGLVFDFMVRMRTGSTFQLQGYGGSASSASAVAGFINSNNPGGTFGDGTAANDVFVGTGGNNAVNYTSGTAALPTTPTLP